MDAVRSSSRFWILSLTSGLSERTVPSSIASSGITFQVFPASTWVMERTAWSKGLTERLMMD